NIIRYPAKNDWPGLLKRPVMDNRSVDELVIPIIEEVRKNGDAALIEMTRKFDKVTITSLQVSEEEFTEAEESADDELKKAIEIAIRNIEAFHRAQQIKIEKISPVEGVECWQKALPIQKVGLYIPGGTAPLFSTVLMLAIPARIAGCKEIILCSPPNSSTGKIPPAVLYAARATGVTRVFKIGGAQAIAAMAFGTESVPKVYKILGPGNQYVTAAKQILSRNEVAIDMPAGPSELAVIANDESNPAFVASDLLSQAEHGIDSQVLLFTTSETMAGLVLSEVARQVKVLPRKDIAERSLENSRILILKNMDEVMEMVNEYAPEHLIIATDNASVLAELVINAGSVFLGHFATESAGDYASGTNHTLPTNGYAKAYNGVNLDDYVKKITFQQITHEGLRYIGPAIMKMAETEELMAHRNAVSIRLNN
ncbi:MAG TPA: histidinol dehydrogenase, partial [Bacteroidales bacterium]|nr:histidinol dehydrogenase [Bacteroidales bacterium]